MMRRCRSGLVVGTATFISYLVAYQAGRPVRWNRRQASTVALITLAGVLVVGAVGGGPAVRVVAGWPWSRGQGWRMC